MEPFFVNMPDLPEEKTWRHAEMILATIERWGDTTIDPKDCEVIGDYDEFNHCCLVILHKPSMRTSGDDGNIGRWRVSGTRYPY